MLLLWNTGTATRRTATCGSRTTPTAPGPRFSSYTDFEYVTRAICDSEWRAFVTDYLAASPLHGMLSYYMMGYPAPRTARNPARIRRRRLRGADRRARATGSRAAPPRHGKRFGQRARNTRARPARTRVDDRRGQHARALPVAVLRVERGGAANRQGIAGAARASPGSLERRVTDTTRAAQLTAISGSQRAFAARSAKVPPRASTSASQPTDVAAISASRR
jgi:hypothetical protein